MCGRFIFFTDDDERIMNIVRESIPGISGLDKYNPRRGNVFPKQEFPIIHEQFLKPVVTDMIWGYPPVSKKSNSLLINARAETAAEKYTFSYDYRHRRCIILATGFYEWSKEKKSYLFSNQSNLLFIGGLYTVTNDTDQHKSEDRFVILTRPPDAVVGSIHNRMPVLIPPELALPWLSDPSLSDSIVNDYSVELNVT